jgi:hypothetical protein
MTIPPVPLMGARTGEVIDWYQPKQGMTCGVQSEVQKNSPDMCKAGLGFTLIVVGL